MMDGLNDFERAVIEKLLDGENAVLAGLRLQASRGRVAARTLSGVGFWCDFEIPSETPPVIPGNFTISDVIGQMHGLEHGAGFVIFVRDGVLRQLEGFTYGPESWPEVIRGYELSYDRQPRDVQFSSPSDGEKS